MTLDAINNSSNDKYLIDLKLNDKTMQGYVGLSSQCTLLRHSVAKRLGIQWSSKHLPTMRGIGPNVIIPIGKATITIEIQGISEQIEMYAVDDSVIKYKILIGHSFTEKPGITIIKTN